MILIIISIRLGQILLLHISITSHTVVIITHYKRMGYVIIPKPNVSGREAINSHCHHFDLLLLGRFGSICRRYDRSCHLSNGALAINHDQSLVHSTEHSRGDSVP